MRRRASRRPVGKRVLMLLENNPFPQDGRVRREALSLASAGYRVTVIAPSAEGQPRAETIDGVRIYRYPGPKQRDGLVGYLIEYGYSMLASALLTIFVAVRSGFDVIHAHNPPDTFFAIAALFKPFGKRFVFDHHDLSPEMYDARFGEDSRAVVRRALLWLEKLSYKMADHVIATNQSYRDVAIERGGVPSDAITIVRNGPELDRVREVPSDMELRKRAATIIGYVGEMGPQDGVDYLLRALHHLYHDIGYTDFFCFIVGRGDAVPHLKRLTAELDLGDHVWFTGRISDEDLMRYMSTADICVDPDPSNPFNDRSTMIKMTEYMAIGKPIVAFDLPEHRYTAGDAAVYATANDELDFARCLADLANDPDRRNAMAELGRQKVETELSWAHQRAKLVSAYETFLSS